MLKFIKIENFGREYFLGLNIFESDYILYMYFYFVFKIFGILFYFLLFIGICFFLIICYLEKFCLNFLCIWFLFSVYL